LTTACWFISASTVTVRAIRDDAQASKFSAAGIATFTASCCYARIAPAALRRGDFENRCVENAEALGCGPEFQSGDFPRIVAGTSLSIA
jgi:hypothetical protein